MKQYEEYTLTTGTVISIKPLAYDVWEQLEDERLEAAEEYLALVECGNEVRAQTVLLRMSQRMRRTKLQSCIEDAATVLPTLLAKEATEAEKHIDSISFAIAVHENLSAAGVGQ